MSVDLSRITGDPAKHYARVVYQQGRVHVEADLNEQQTIENYRAETTNTDVIGQTGCPKIGGGFGIALTADSADLTISAGRMYVDGILAELTPTEQTITMLAADSVKVPLWRVDGRDFAAEQYVVVHVPGQAEQVVKITQADAAGRALSLSAPIVGFVASGPARLRRDATLLVQPDSYANFRSPPLAAGRYRVYLDVWEQELTWIVDPSIREFALGFL